MADAAASQIVEQYYDYIENGQLDLLVALYRPESKMARMVDSVVHRFENLHDIEAQILTWDYSEILYDTISCESWHQGILVAVIGIMNTPGFIGPRRFAQSLFLAPENDTFFILSDIFCFVRDIVGSSSTTSPSGHDTDPNASSSVGDNEASSQPVLMEHDPPRTTTDSSSEPTDCIETDLSTSLRNPSAHEVRSQPRLDPDKSLDIQNITLDPSTSPSDENAVDIDLCSFSTFRVALEHVRGNGEPNTEPVKTMHDPPVEEPAASTADTSTVASSEEPQKHSNADVLKSRPKATQRSMTAIQSSGRPGASTDEGWKSLGQPALMESAKSLDIKDESLDQAEDQQEKNPAYVNGVLPDTVPVKAVHITPVEKPVLSAANTTNVASTEYLQSNISFRVKAQHSPSTVT